MATNDFWTDPLALVTGLVSTDQADYAPGDLVTITATGFEPGSAFQFLVEIVSDAGLDGLFGTADDTVDAALTAALAESPWWVTDGLTIRDANGVAIGGDLDGLANGSVTTTWVVDADALNQTLRLVAATADGQLAMTSFTDGPNNASSSLSQWANGPLANPKPSDYTWQNGNLNANQASYFEGESVPYRVDLDSLLKGATYYLTIAWDTTEGGRHALDYLTTWDRSFAAADPNYPLPLKTPPPSGGFQFNPNPPLSDTFLIPVDPLVKAGRDGLLSTADDITQQSGSFTLFNGDLLGYLVDAGADKTVGTADDVVWDGVGDPNPYRISGTYAGSSQTQLTVIFTYTGETGTDAALLWGGHIASRQDWGAGSSAGAINGSPYHMRLQNPLPPLGDVPGTDPLPSGFYSPGDSTASTGQQDRSLSSAVVIIPATITVVKNAIPDGPTAFDYEFVRPANTIDVIDGLLDLSGDLLIDTDDDGIFVTNGITYTIQNGLITSGQTSLNGFAILGGALNVNTTGEPPAVITVADDLSNLAGVGTVTFTLVDSGSGTTNTKTFDGLVDFVAGYQVKELLEPGWDLTNVNTSVLDIDGLTTTNPSASNPTLITLAEGDSWTVTYTNQPSAPVLVPFEGNKFEDLDANGIWSKPAEPGLAGWTISVYGDTDGDGVLDLGEYTLANQVFTGTTGGDPLGNLQNINLSTGPGGALASYIVVEGLQSPYTQSAPADWDVVAFDSTDIGQLGYAVSISDTDNDGAVVVVVNNVAYPENATRPTFDFGNWRPASKSGMKFEDLNADGVKDAGEPGLAGWTIYVDYDNDGAVDANEPSAVTVSGGTYTINGIKPGNWAVKEVMQSGWTNSYPATGFYQETFTSGATLSGNDFGNWRPASKSGMKFEDLNADGVKDTGEPGLAGWTIYVDYDNDGAVDANEPSAVTVSGGTYTINGIKPGNWAVKEVMQSGWTNSYPATGFYQETFTSGATLSGNDFGNWRPASKSGMKFEDLNADGVKDTGEPGLAGWTIYVDYDNDGAVDANEPSAVTVSGGTYTINGIKPGNWAVKEVMQSGWTNSYPATGFYQETFTSGATLSGNDFGNWRPASKSGMKFEDLNADGVKDAGEPGLAGWTIYVDYDNDGVVDANEPSAVTVSGGTYTINGIKPGNWAVKEVMQSGWTNSYPATGFYQETFTSGATLSGNDFGNWRPASKSGMKFEDLNADGVKDTGEPGLAGWTIYVDYDNDGAVDANEPSAVTVSGGTYTINGIKPGNWAVKEVMQSGWTNSYPATGFYQETFTSGATLSGNDFGNWRPASKSGMKFEDLNADGVKDAGEPGLAGWTIYVDYDNDGVVDANEPSAVTVSGGTYTINGIKPGNWAVKEVMQSGWTNSYPATGFYQETFTSGATLSGNDFGNWRPASKSGMKFEDLNADGVKDAGEPGLAGWTIYVDYDNDGAVDANEPSAVTVSGGTYTINGIKPGNWAVKEVMQSGWTNSYPATGFYQETFTSGATLSGNDFGNWRPASKSGMKFEDLNADGVKDAGEPGLAGWTIYVDYDNDGAVDANEPSAVTVSGGTYTINGIKPGNWAVKEVMQSGWTNSYPATGFYQETFTSGATLSGNDFGNWRPASKSGMKFEDLNADGVKDTGEPGLAGWTIYVDYDNDGAVDANEPSAVTVSGGTYTINGIKPGNWAVKEVMQSGWTNSYPATGFYQETFTSGATLSGNDFGNWRPASKSGTKYEDVNGSGSRDPGEPGLAGWTINLVGTAGTGAAVSRSTTTNADGFYEFLNLTPGNYTVSEVQQMGWIQTAPDTAISGDAGDNDGGALDGDWDIVLKSGDVDQNNDFGNRRIGTCGWTPGKWQGGSLNTKAVGKKSAESVWDGKVNDAAQLVQLSPQAQKAGDVLLADPQRARPMVEYVANGTDLGSGYTGNTGVSTMPDLAIGLKGALVDWNADGTRDQLWFSGKDARTIINVGGLPGDKYGDMSRKTVAYLLNVLGQPDYVAAPTLQTAIYNWLGFHGSSAKDNFNVAGMAPNTVSGTDGKGILANVGNPDIASGDKDGDWVINYRTTGPINDFGIGTAGGFGWDGTFKLASSSKAWTGSATTDTNKDGVINYRDYAAVTVGKSGSTQQTIQLYSGQWIFEVLSAQFEDVCNLALSLDGQTAYATSGSLSLPLSQTGNNANLLDWRTNLALYSGADLR